MAFNYSPKAVTDGLIVYIDAANVRSYPGTGTIANNLTGKEFRYVDQFQTTDKQGLTFSFMAQASWNSSNLGTFQFPVPVGSATASRLQGGEDLEWNSAEMTADVWVNRTVSNNPKNIIWSIYFPYVEFTDGNRFRVNWATEIVGNTVQSHTLQTANSFSNNVWYNVCCTISSNPMSGINSANIYVDGVLEATTTTVQQITGIYPTPWMNRNGINIGNGSGTRNGIGGEQRFPFVGKISSFKLYNRILTPEEVLRNYNALKARYAY